MAAVADKFVIKAGDLIPAIQGVCLDAAGVPVDLSDADVVTFRMTPERAKLAPDISEDANVVDPTGGVVEYDWLDGNTDIVGAYRGEFHVLWLDGSRETFPTDGYIVVEVQSPARAT